MKILYVKTNNQRSKFYQVRTIIYEEKGKRFIKKEAARRESIAHLKQMKANYESLKKTIINPDIKLAKIIDESDNSLTFEFIDGVSAEQLFNNAIKEGEDSVSKFLLTFQNTLENGFKTELFNNISQKEFVHLFGNVNTSKLKNRVCFENISNIDLIFSNIIYKDSIMYIVDYEWVYNCSVPIDYVIFRAVNYQINSYKHNINQELIEVFSAMEDYFQNTIVNDKNSFAVIGPKFQQNRLSLLSILRKEKLIFKVQRLYRYLLSNKN